MTTIARRFSTFVLLWTVLGAPAWAYDEAEAKRMSDEMKKYHFEDVATKEGLNFRIPADMPIESKNGLIQPISFDEYLYVKFKLIQERMVSLEKKVDEMKTKLDAVAPKMDTLNSKLDVILNQLSSRAPSVSSEPAVPSQPAA